MKGQKRKENCVLITTLVFVPSGLDVSSIINVVFAGSLGMVPTTVGRQVLNKERRTEFTMIGVAISHENKSTAKGTEVLGGAQQEEKVGEFK